MLEDKFAQHDKEVVDKFVNPNADFVMRTWDYVVRPSADGASGPITGVLPVVAEAKGRFYSIIVRNADAVNTVTITHKDDSECWIADIVMDGKCDRLLMYSDGLAWIPCMGIANWPGIVTTPPPGTVGVTTSAP